MNDKHFDSLEQVEKKRKSKLLYLFIFIFVLGFASGFYLYTHPEITMFSSTAVAASSLKGYGWEVKVSPEIDSRFVIEETGIEKELIDNIQLQTVGNLLYVSGDINQTYANKLKTFDSKDAKACSDLQKGFKKSLDCTQVKEEITKITTDGLKVYDKTGTQKSLIGINTNSFLTTCDITLLKEGVVCKIGDNSITVTFQSTAGNYGINATTQSNLYSRLNTSVDAPYSNLVGYWSFDSDTTTTAYDWGNNGLNGAYSGATNENGVYERASKFDGINDMINVSDNDALTIRNVSISLWIKHAGHTGDTAEHYLLKGNNDGFNAEYAVLWLASTNKIRFYYNSTTYAESTTSPTVGQWYHITAIWNDATNNGSIYVNGVIEGSSIGERQTLNSAVGMGFGSAMVGTVKWFNGSLDDIMIFNTHLSATDVANIYANQSSRFYPNGIVDYPQTNLSLDATDNSFNISIQGLNKTLGSNAQLRMGEWDVSDGYNDTDGNLVGYWHGDGNANDYSGNGNDGTLANGATAGNYGVYNSSFGFDGVNDLISVADSNSLDIPNVSLTISAWINPKTFGTLTPNTFGRIVRKGSNYDFMIVNGTNYATALATAASIACSVNSGITMNVWQNVVVVQNSTGATFYKDGILQGHTACGIGATNSDTLAIGNYDTTGAVGRYFNGSIDEVMIFNRSLTASEIRELYVKGRANWTYSPLQNLSTDSTIYTRQNLSTTNYLPEIVLTAGTNNFYTPLIFGNITFSSQAINPIVTLILPTNNTLATTLQNYFVGNATTISNLKNATLNVWNSTNNIVITNETTISGTYAQMNLSGTLPYGGVFKWNYYVCDDASNCIWATNNFTITYDNIAPTMTYVSPTETSNVTRSQTYIDVNVTSTDSGSGLKNITIFLYNSTNNLINSTNSTTSPLYIRFSSYSDGVYYYNATSSDVSDNTAWLETRNITLDTTVSPVTIISPENDSTVSTITPTLNVSCDADTVQANYSLNGGINTTFTLNSTTLVTGTGATYVIVTCMDSAGNIGQNRSDFTVSLGAGSLCGVSAASTRLNETTVQLGATSWDTAGSYATYVLSGTCKNQTGSITFPSWTTISAGVYRAFLTTTEQGTCTISAPACTKAETSWIAWSNSTGGGTTPTSSCTVNATSLQSKSPTRPYGQLCRGGEFK